MKGRIRLELQAIAIDRAKRVIYTAAIRGEALTIWIVDPRSESVQEQPVDVGGLSIKRDRRLAELEVIGLGTEDGTLYALTSPANRLLVIDTEAWRVREAIGLEGLGDSQGMSVADGSIHVVTDHEYHEPLPPLRSAELPGVIRAAP